MHISEAFVAHDIDTILRDMLYFLNNLFPTNLQVSKIHYMELVNENPDSDKTMSLVV